MQALSYLYESKSNLFRIREQIRMNAPRVTTAIHWALLIVLAISLGVLFLFLRTDEILSKIIVGVFIASVYLILLLLDEVDSNRFLEDALVFKDVQQTFFAIGKMSYYPPNVFKKSTKKITGVYRIGRYKNYPVSFEKEILVIDDRKIKKT